MNTAALQFGDEGYCHIMILLIYIFFTIWKSSSHRPVIGNADIYRSGTCIVEVANIEGMEGRSFVVHSCITDVNYFLVKHQCVLCTDLFYEYLIKKCGIIIVKNVVSIFHYAQ